MLDAVQDLIRHSLDERHGSTSNLSAMATNNSVPEGLEVLLDHPNELIVRHQNKTHHKNHRGINHFRDRNRPDGVDAWNGNKETNRPPKVSISQLGRRTF